VTNDIDIEALIEQATAEMADEDRDPDLDLTPAEIIEKYPVDYIGPSWQRDDNGGWLLPKHTLGWQIAGWCARYLKGLGDMPRWKFTPEQLRLILWWYAVDERGRFVYQSGVIQRLKGHGKDPLCAVMCLIEAAGPSRFAGWDKNGQPVGKAHPQALVQIAAVNLSQTKNTFSLFAALMSDDFKKAYGVTVAGIEVIRFAGGQEIEAVTTNPRALEGKRSTFVVLNETQHWVESGRGHDMYQTMLFNCKKVKSRYMAITNAFMPGEDSVAERMRQEYEWVQEGKANDAGLMYDSIEAHPATPLIPNVLYAIIPLIRGDSTWLDIETIVESMNSTSIDVERLRRMWLNQVVASSDALYGMPELAAIEDRDGEDLMPGDEITLGFDGGKSDDATALVALRIRDQKAFLIGLWEKEDKPGQERWEVPRDRVDSAVREAFAIYDVKAFYADVALWESYIAEWDRDYAEGLMVKAEGRSSIGWDMRQSLQTVTRAHERLVQAIFDVKVKYDGDLKFRRHMLNVRRRHNNYGVSFGKESRESPKKIDAYAAFLLAFEAAYDVRTKGKKQKVRTGRGWFF
jgi:hypothetical protein